MHDQAGGRPAACCEISRHASRRPAMTEAIAKVAVRRLPHAEGLPLPAYHSPGAVGLDLFAALPSNTRVVLEPGSRYLVQTGIALALPQDYEAQVRPRSGLARDYGVT